jgi:type I restriction enzyme S subunit
VKPRSYPDYKDSGVEWLGAVPAHWEVKPLKHLTDFINGAAFKPEDWSQSGVPIIRIENLNGGENFNGYEGSVPKRYHVAKGDLLFGWSGNRGTSFGPFLWPREGMHYLNQHIFRLANFSCDRSWFYWALKAVTKTIEDEAHGIIGMVHVTKGKLGAVRIPFLPLAEQRAIAAYLDRETERVDELVGKQRALIERLKEKRTALISRTVTRGLPPAAARAAGLPENPQCKPSGLDWLGDIPAHWEVWKHAHLFKSSMGQTILKEEVLDEGPLPVLSATEQYEIFGYLEHATVILEAGDLVIPARGNSIGHVKLVREKSTTTQTTIYSKHLTRRVSPAFAFYYILGHRNTLFHFDRTAIPQLTVNQVANNPVLLPPLPEQTAIAAYLDAETAKLDVLVAKVEAVIERLQEYRAALITAAVTGKIDVRPGTPNR